MSEIEAKITAARTGETDGHDSKDNLSEALPDLPPVSTPEFKAAKVDTGILAIIRTNPLLSIAVAAAISCGLVLALAAFLTEPPLVVIEAESEFVSYEVKRPIFASLVLRKGFLARAGEQCPSEVKNGNTVGIFPKAGSLVRYTQLGDQLSIRITNTGSAGKLDGAAVCDLSEDARFLIQLGSEETLDNQLVLPIAGPLEIGIEQIRQKASDNAAGNAGFLYSAAIRVYGRTGFPGSRERVYPAQGGAFDVPAGGRLTTEGNGYGYGYAIPGKRAMRVSVSTESGELRLIRAGSSRDDERFAVSLLSQTLNDPSFGFLTLLIFVVSLIMQTIAAGISIRDASR